MLDFRVDWGILGGCGILRCAIISEKSLNFGNYLRSGLDSFYD
jgi:hypothetical protein